MKEITDKKIICIDFDGVLHSYTSGWQGPREIIDPPVNGAIGWLEKLLRNSSLEICIYSSRSKCFGGKRAMRKWLMEMGLHRDHLQLIKFPTKKPAAWVTIDDRAIVFRGEFPKMEEIVDFKSWNQDV